MQDTSFLLVLFVPSGKGRSYPSPMLDLLVTLAEFTPFLCLLGEGLLASSLTGALVVQPMGLAARYLLKLRRAPAYQASSKQVRHVVIALPKLAAVVAFKTPSNRSSAAGKSRCRSNCETTKLARVQPCGTATNSGEA